MISASRYTGRWNDGGLFALLGTSVCLILVFSHFASFLTSKFGIPSTPVSLGVVAIGLAVGSGVLVKRRLQHPVLVVLTLVAAYLLILFIGLMFTDRSADVLVRARVTWALVLVASIVVMSNFRSLHIFLRIFRSVVFLSSVLLALEFASGFSLPLELTTVKGRAAGLFENPNNAGLFLALALPIVTIGLKLKARAFWYLAIIGVIFLTFSRGAIVLAGLAILVSELMPAGQRGAISLKRAAVCVAILLAGMLTYLVGSALFISAFGDQLDANTIARARLQGDDSSDVRIDVLRLAWFYFTQSPIWGHGTGAGERWLSEVSVHNQVGLLLLEYGVVGLAWFIAFVASLFAMPKPYGAWAALMFLAASQTSHNLMDGATHAVLLGIFVALPALTGEGKGAPVHSVRNTGRGNVNPVLRDHRTRALAAHPLRRHSSRPGQ